MREAYNKAMKHLLPTSLRAVTVAALLALPVAGGCFAQTGSPAASNPSAAQPKNISVTPAPATGRPDPAVQRIHTEDASTRIDELRVGGETQSITVQPKTNSKLPAYEVKPADTTKANAPSSSSDTNGARVWNVLKF